MVNHPILEFKNLYFGYGSQRSKTLRGINLQVFSGDRIGIIGDNGCGKSTISKLILGILSPQKGEVCLYGKPVKWRHHYSSLGYVGDPGHNAEELGLPTNLTVGAVLKTIQRVEVVSGEKCSELVIGLGLQTLLSREIKHLSTGERKRLMVCLTFLRNPTFFVMDEPLDGLDESIRRFIEARLKQELEKSETTLFYIAHDKVEIDNFTDKVFRLHEGELIHEPQKCFSGYRKKGDDSELFQGKTGQIIGRLTNWMIDEADQTFDIHISPINCDDYNY